MTLSLWLLAAALWPASAQNRMTAPLAPPSVRQLHDEFIEAMDDGRKREVLRQLARTPPVTVLDIQALYDLFMRLPDDAVRRSALDSLQLLAPQAQNVEPILLRFLQEDDPASVIFGIKAALRLRSPAALPIIRKIARRSFTNAAAGDAPILSERNAWWAQYEALAALAQWEKGDALPLLTRKASEAPAVARLLGLFLWPESLKQIARWASGGRADAQRAAEALDAPTPPAALRATREAMLGYLRDPKANAELRHKLALKIGMSSTPAEVGALLKEYDDAADAQTKTLLAAALFSSRDPQVAALLLRFAKEDPQPAIRTGARLQLKDMLPAADYRALLEWAAANEPDAENRDLALRELSGK